jgi:hypothetical protein
MVIYIRNLIKIINKIPEFKNKHGHDVNHFVNVYNHAIKAVKYENISDITKEKIKLAALLHDLDNGKIFPINKNIKRFNER